MRCHVALLFLCLALGSYSLFGCYGMVNLCAPNLLGDLSTKGWVKWTALYCFVGFVFLLLFVATRPNPPLAVARGVTGVDDR